MQFTDPQSQGPARAARRALASLLTPSLGLLIAGLSAGQDRAQGDLKVPGAIPYFNPDLKTDAPVQVLKDGVTPTDLSHLTLAERSAYNDRWNALLEQRAPGASALEAKAGATLDVNAMKSGVDARRFHQLDRASDGTLWAFGGDYKASFGVDGATYIPFLGSGAPQSYPLTFQVLEATLGRAPLALDHTALASFDGATAVYERGALQERYATRVGSLEQLFVFDRLPGNGDLVVRLRVTSELAGAATTDGLAWSNDLGGVTYSSAVAIDAAGRAVAAPTTLQDGVVELRVPAAFVASARLPLTIDPVLATYTVAATTAVELNPDIAYDNDNGRFLICWEREFSATDHDVWGEMFDPFGNPIAGSGAYIDFTGSSWTRPKCANNRAATQFLVVASLETSTTSDIWGREREAEDLTQSAQFLISSGFGNKRYPDVGGDPHPAAPSYYCVVWEREFSVGVDHDIHAQLVTTGGTLQAALINVDNSSATYDKYPSVSKSNGLAPTTNQEWNLCWNRQFSTTDWDVRGAQIHWDGALTTPSFSIDFSGAHDLLPKASTSLDLLTGPRTYAVVYQRLDGADWDIYASALRADVRIAADNLSHLWVTGSANDEEYPVVDCNGHHFAVAYQRRFVAGSGDYDIYVSGVYLAGGAFRISEGPLNLAFSGSFEGYPEMASRYSAGTISDFCGVVWYDATPTGDIEGALYELPDNFGQVNVPYCSSNNNSTGVHGALSVTGSSIRARNELVLSAWQLPTNATLFFLTSLTSGFVQNPGGAAGNLCLGGNIGRYVGPGQIQNTGGAGQASLVLDLSQHPTPNGLVSVTAGQTWRFQAWHRDTNGSGGSTSNFTDASSVLFN